MPHLDPSPDVLDIARCLETAGYETWFVGGAVRDALLGHPHLDWDLATSATPPQVQALFGHRRTIPVGIEFGTVGVLDRRGTLHEVTTFRRDVQTDGRHAVVAFGVSLDDDLARRDFTINAMAYSASRDEIRDPFNGQRDLERGLIRAVGDAEARMREDRLRALRGIRFAARLAFEIDPATLAAITHSAPHLGRLSPERVKQELDKTLEQVRLPSAALRLWRETGAFATLIPPLAHATDADLQVPDYLAKPSIAGRPQRKILRVAGVFAGLEAVDVERILTGLRYSKHETQWAARTIGRWRAVRSRLEDAVRRPSGASDRDVRAWIAAIGRLQVPAVARLASAIWDVERAAGRSAPAPSAVRSLYRRMLRSAFRDPVELHDLAIDGDDLRRAGVPPGPRLGKILQTLLELVLEDPARNRTDWLLQEAQRLDVASRPSGS
jgi:tRNA nucleotidyltransferase (CCA-adding enzyme)